MTQDEINEYRNEIATQLKEKESELETNISNVTAAMLALFLTINEKFIPISTSEYKFLFIISTSAFGTSFIAGLIKKHQTTKFDREIIDFIDNNEDLTKSTEEQKLLELWSKADKNLYIWKLVTYITLSVAIITQIFYFFLNANKTETKEKETNILKIELHQASLDTLINVKKSNIKINIHSNPHNINVQEKSQNNTSRDTTKTK